MNQPDTSRAARGAVLEAVLHGVLWLLWAAGMLWAGPRLMHDYRDFSMKLPAASEHVMAVALWLATYWYVLLPVLAAGLGADALVGYQLRRNADLRPLRWLWSLLMFGLPLMVLFFSFMGLYLAFVKIQEALHR